MHRILLAAFPLLAASLVQAQTNTIPGVDLALTEVRSFTYFGSEGQYPTGRSGFAMTTDVCNVGSVDVPWFEAFRRSNAQYTSEYHPFYAFLVARENNGRFEQISDWSFVKHGFFSLNDPNCGQCQNPGTRDFLGPNCSDVYSVFNNSSRFHLGPASEIDPWTGSWSLFGSHFDVGEPASAPDGQRSLTSTQTRAFNDVHHRVEIDDADLDVTGAQYYYGAMVLTQGEDGSLKADNVRHREFVPSWNNGWNVSTVSPSQTDVILQRWSGATVTHGQNGQDDGRFYVGVVVAGPTDGMWHYEYAILNRDNKRGGAQFRLPICPNANVANLWFGDIDSDPSNDWAASVQGSEIVFASHGGNFHEWNTIFNVAFDSDAAPVQGMASIDQARMGPGALSVSVPTTVPGSLPNVIVGVGCGSPQAPTLWANDIATIPNPAFSLTVQAQPGAGLFAFNSLQEVQVPLAMGCTQYLDPQWLETWGFGLADAAGRLVIPIAVPNAPALEGLDMTWQVAEVAPGGPVLGTFQVSHGLRIRVGNSRSHCP